MKINKQLLDMYGITETDYKRYCKANKKRKCAIATKSEFFQKLMSGELVVDSNKNVIKRTEN